MDQVGSGAGQALGPVSQCSGISHLRDSPGAGASQVCPLGIPQEGAQNNPPCSALPSHKRHAGLGPGGFLALSGLSGPPESPEVAGE